MIGGSRYIEGDTIVVSNQTRRDLGLQVVQWEERTPALDWYTSDPIIIKESTREPGYGGIRWGLLGLILADAVDDLIGTFMRIGAFIGDITSSLLNDEMRLKYRDLMADLRFANSPLFGDDRWDPAVFPEGKVDLEFTANLLLGILVASYIVFKVFGLVEGVVGLVTSLKARAVVNARHNTLLKELDQIDKLISTIPKPVLESQFKMLDDQITPQAIRSLTEALVSDRASPLNSLYKKYPQWGLFPE
jgi:hypothetical protein